MDNETMRRLEALERTSKELQEIVAHIPVRFATGGGEGEVVWRGKLTSAFTKGTPAVPTSATAERWAPASAAAGAAKVATGTIDTIYDDGMLPDDGLEIGTWIQWRKINGQWWYDGGC